MKVVKMEWMPVASRSRKQRELREKELREKNKRARLAARNQHWKKNAAKRSGPCLGNDDENVIVVDESAYLKRASMVGEKESFLNHDAGFEEISDDSIEILGEKWNPLGAGFDNNEDQQDVDALAVDFQPAPGCSTDNAVDLQPGPSKAASKCCSTDNGVDFQRSPSKGCSTDNGAIDGHCSSTLQSSETDDNVSDEDFSVDEAEMQTVYSSDSSSYAAEKLNDEFLDEDILSRDAFDGDYLQWLRHHYGSCSNDGEKADIFDTSVNGGNRKRGRPQKNTSPEFEYEAEDRAMPQNCDCSKNGSFIQSSPLPYHSTSNNGATSELIGSESESENDPIGECAKSEIGGNRKRGTVSHFEDIKDGDELYLEWLQNMDLSGRSDNGGKRKQRRLPKRYKVGPQCEPMPKNGGYRKRGRPPNKTFVEIESESEDDLVRIFGKFQNGGNRERGKLPQFEDDEDGDENCLQWLYSLELSARGEKGGNSKRGRPRKGRNVGVCSAPKNYGHQQRDRPPKNGGYGKRGRPPMNWNKGIDSERVCKRGRGRPLKNRNKGI